MKHSKIGEITHNATFPKAKSPMMCTQAIMLATLSITCEVKMRLIRKNLSVEVKFYSYFLHNLWKEMIPFRGKISPICLIGTSELKNIPYSMQHFYSTPVALLLPCIGWEVSDSDSEKSYPSPLKDFAESSSVQS